MEKGEKVYILSKSTGDSWYVAMSRVKKYKKYKSEPVTYNGNYLNAVVGYYNYKLNLKIHVIAYPKLNFHLGGDFYLRKDFITEEELRKDNMGRIEKISNSMFKII